MSLFRRNPKRLPGSLCDETVTPDANPERRSNCATCGTPITWRTSHMWGDRWTHDGIQEAAEEHDATPVAGKWQPRTDDDVQQLVADGPGDADQIETVTVTLDNRTAVYTPSPRAHVPMDRRALEDAYLAVCEQNREIRDDHDKLSDANGRLVARLRHRNQLLAQFLSPEAVAELERADAVASSPPIDDTVPMPRVRSLTPHDHGGDLVTPWPADTKH